MERSGAGGVVRGDFCSVVRRRWSVGRGQGRWRPLVAMVPLPSSLHAHFAFTRTSGAAFRGWGQVVDSWPVLSSSLDRDLTFEKISLLIYSTFYFFPSLKHLALN